MALNLDGDLADDIQINFEQALNRKKEVDERTAIETATVIVNIYQGCDSFRKNMVERLRSIRKQERELVAKLKALDIAVDGLADGINNKRPDVLTRAAVAAYEAHNSDSGACYFISCQVRGAVTCKSTSESLQRKFASIIEGLERS